MSRKKMKHLLRLIDNAFHLVELDDGISLKEAHALAYRMSHGQTQRLRDTDESYNWKNISHQNLEKYISALPFFDAKGLLFHLPAYMAYLIQKHDTRMMQIERSVVLSLTPNEDNKEWFIDRFSLFNMRQREAITTFLHWKKIRSDDHSMIFHIDKALRYWQ
jgi:hypothetical protein